MLEVRYNQETKAVTGWWDSRFGNHEVKLRDRPDEVIVMLDIPVPPKPLGSYLYDEAAQTLMDNPDYVGPSPPLSTHWAMVDSINLGGEKPISVKRSWEGEEYTVACYVSEAVKDQYLAGDIAIGDYVMVEFLEDKADRAVVFAKVFKTW